MPRRDMIIVVSLLVAIGLGTVLALRPTILFNLNGTALGTSVEGSLNHHSSEPHVDVTDCSPLDSGDWACTVDHDPGSNALSGFRVHADGDGCWTGERLLAQVFGRSHPGASDLRGCVRLWDYSGFSL